MDPRKIIVCVKQVPEASELRFDPVARTLIREGVENILNPFDRRGVTQASRMKGVLGGEVVAITMGPPQAMEVLIECLAMGADRGLHLLGSGFAGSDTLATSRALAMAIRRESPFSLIFCGKYSVDAETGQVGPEVAELLDIPHITGATGIGAKADNKLVVERETDYGFETLEVKLPALLTAAERLVKPYKPTTQDFEAARRKPIHVLTPADLSGETSIFGSGGSPTHVAEIRSVEIPRLRIMIEGGSPAEKAARLSSMLLERGAVQASGETRRKEVRVREEVRTDRERRIWIMCETVQGRIRDVTFELMGRGLELCGPDGELWAVCFGGEKLGGVRDQLFEHGADTVLLLEHECLSEYNNESYSDALSKAIKEFRPFAVLAPSTSEGRDYIPRVAARLGLGLTGDCIGLEIDEKEKLIQLKPAFGGRVVAPIVSTTSPQMATVRPGVLTRFEGLPGRRGRLLNYTPPEVRRPRSKLVKRTLVDPEDALGAESSDIVIGVGMGIGGPEALEFLKPLAERLGAPIVATRKVVDQGWLPRQLQVGLTGRTLSPSIYIAVGISGAFNHTVGIGRSGTVVAINTDPQAEIFEQCDYGIVGDYREILPELVNRLVEVRSKTPGTGSQ